MFSQEPLTTTRPPTSATPELVGGGPDGKTLDNFSVRRLHLSLGMARHLAGPAVQKKARGREWASFYRSPEIQGSR